MSTGGFCLNQVTHLSSHIKLCSAETFCSIRLGKDLSLTWPLVLNSSIMSVNNKSAWRSDASITLSRGIKLNLTSEAHVLSGEPPRHALQLRRWQHESQHQSVGSRGKLIEALCSVALLTPSITFFKRIIDCATQKAFNVLLCAAI